MIYFKLYFDEHRDDLLVWEVEAKEQGGQTSILNVKYVHIIGLFLTTTYLGKDGETPKAYLSGCANKMERMWQDPDCLVIT